MSKPRSLPDDFVVAIDGPAGSGKSTMARLLAEKLGLVSIDTGAMYRSVTAKALDLGVDPSDEKKVAAIAESIRIEFRREGEKQKTFVDGSDFTSRIREADVNENVSTVAANPEVRRRMVELQRRMGAHGRVVMEGRDIGSNVFPAAMFKFYLTADSGERAERRLLEINETGGAATKRRVMENIEDRDRKDSSREHSPLARTADAVEIDTTNLSVDEVLQIMLQKMFFILDSSC